MQIRLLQRQTWNKNNLKWPVTPESPRRACLIDRHGTLEDYLPVVACTPTPDPPPWWRVPLHLTHPPWWRVPLHLTHPPGGVYPPWWHGIHTPDPPPSPGLSPHGPPATTNLREAGQVVCTCPLHARGRPVEVGGGV